MGGMTHPSSPPEYRPAPLREGPLTGRGVGSEAEVNARPAAHGDALDRARVENEHLAVPRESHQVGRDRDRQRKCGRARL